MVGLGLIAVTSAASLDSVSFRFCDDVNDKIYLANQKVIAVKPGEDNEMCVNFVNNADEKVKVLYGFSYGFLNEAWTQVCDQDSSRNNKFSKFFVQSWDSALILEAWEQKTLKVKIKVPLWIKGMQYGCFIDTVEGASAKKSEGSMFSVVVRKVFPLNLFVGEPGEIKNALTLKAIGGGLYSTNSKIKAEIKDGSNLDISTHIKNEWNITQTVQISGTLYNFLGFEKSFSSQEIKLTPGEEKDFVANVGIIPGYKGVFTVNMKVTGTPFFDFDISGMDESIKKGSSISVNGMIYAFSRTSVIALIALIVIILLIVRPRKRQVVVQKA